MRQTLLVILNPKSGQGTGHTALEKLKNSASEENIQLEVLTTEAQGDAKRFAQTHSFENVDALISIGGDGTLNEVVNGLLSREDEASIPLGILPMGTGNSLMKDLGCETVEQAIEDVFSWKRFKMDAFEANVDGEVRYGFNMVGCGIPSAVNHYAEQSRAFKSLRYEVGILKALCAYRSVGYQIKAPEIDLEMKSDFILLSNTQHIGSGICIAPDARLDDGKLDAAILEEHSKRSLLSLFLKLRKGTHLTDSRVTRCKGSSFSITAPHEQEVNIDGEQISFMNLDVKVLPQRLELLHVPDNRRTDA